MFFLNQNLMFSGIVPFLDIYFKYIPNTATF